MEGGRVLVHKIIARNSSSFYFFSFCFLILSVLLTTIAGSFLDIEKGQNTILFFLDGVVVLITGIFQGVYFWIKKNAKARETLIAKKQIYLQYNFNALKSKNVIEFLQDSLITTIKLIKKDSELTARQIEKLTSILRYLLQSRDEKFVRLGAELKNVVEYCELAEIQLNNTIDLQMNIASKFHETQIPPLVFQMVLDNQFKSFSETGKGLLKIEVYIENAKFIVVKTSQPTKKINAFKNEQFINNLKQRYQLYNKASGVSELSTMSEYFIKFPLLAG
jgi:LytS/YehU family sensor histidine kinase